MPSDTVTLRDYLTGNMFDGSEDGVLTMKISLLLDEVTELVSLWFIESTGAADNVEKYYTADLVGLKNPKVMSD